MYSIERVQSIPQELLSSLSDISSSDLCRWTRVTQAIMPLAKDAWYVKRSGVPLLMVGMVKLSLLSPNREAFMYGSKYLHWTMLPTLRELMMEKLSEFHFPIYARANSPERAKFLRFFGYQFLHLDMEGNEVYEVRAWQS